jgi:hypothetical protein
MPQRSGLAANYPERMHLLPAVFESVANLSIAMTFDSYSKNPPLNGADLLLIGTSSETYFSRQFGPYQALFIVSRFASIMAALQTGNRVSPLRLMLRAFMSASFCCWDAA